MFWKTAFYLFNRAFIFHTSLMRIWLKIKLYPFYYYLLLLLSKQDCFNQRGLNLNLEALINELENDFAAHADSEKSVEMKKYMRNQFSFFGIQSVQRRLIQTRWLKNNTRILNNYTPVELAEKLFEKKEREFQLTAIDILFAKRKQLTVEDLPALENWVTTKSWWDTVDLIATKIIGHILKENPDKQKQYMQKWVQSNHLWLQRTALLFQLKYKSNTDEQLLEVTIRSLKHIDDFFIQKAIGWALREYYRTNPNWVKNVIIKLELTGLSKREALRNSNDL